jgi:hypothetical protein
MNLKPNLLITTAAGVALATVLAAGSAFAQADWRATIDALAIDAEAVGAGDFTTATVAVEDPFGDLEVDTAATDPAVIGAAIAVWTPEQLTELVERCNVILEAGTTYAADVTAYCGVIVDDIFAAGDAAAAPGAAPMLPTPAPMTPTPPPAP